jgi:hypothetical protein
MLGYGGPADRKPLSQLADCERAVREVVDDRPPCAVAEDAPFVVQVVSLHER